MKKVWANNSANLWKESWCGEKNYYFACSFWLFHLFCQI